MKAQTQMRRAKQHSQNQNRLGHWQHQHKTHESLLRATQHSHSRGLMQLGRSFLVFTTTL